MRIDDILKQQGVQQETDLKTRKGDRNEGAFEKLLESEMSGVGSNVGADPVLGPGGLNAVWGIESMTAGSELSQPISALENTLSSIDLLGEALQGNKSPKEIDTIIARINSSAAELDEKLSGLPADHPLKDMAEEVKVAAYIESVKWKRGDYL
ncbi:MAG: hypothetical protein AB9866_11675 [Syntrophobacteraceae bacterium]